MPITYNDYNIRTTNAANLALQVGNRDQPIMWIVADGSTEKNGLGALQFADNHPLNPSQRVNILSNITGLRIYPGNMSNDQSSLGTALTTGRCYSGMAIVGDVAGVELWNNITRDRKWEYYVGSAGSSVVMNFGFGVAPPNGSGAYFTEGRWLSNGIECARLETTGRFFVNCTQSFYTGEAKIYIVSANNTTAQLLVALGGSSFSFSNALVYRDNTGVKAAFQVADGACQFASLSDHRLKTNIEDLTGARDMVDQLRPITFRHIDDADDDIPTMGFIAHEVQAVYPDAVFGERDAVDPETGDPRLQNMDAVKLIPMLVAAAKELRAEIQSLENQLGIA